MALKKSLVETEYDDIPSISQRNDGRANQAIIIDTGKHAALITNCAIVCGICMALAVVCAGICWWTITEYRIVLNHYMELESAVKELRNGQ